MAAPATDHNVAIRDAAREDLAPLGLVQKGRSRIWLDDHAWYLIQVEFQPSGFGKGSYLNVGAMWLWSPKDFLSFDHGDRVRHFEEANGDFTAQARSLASTAASRVLELREEVGSLESIAAVFADPDPGWPTLHAAIAAGLLGDVSVARRHFDAIVRLPVHYDWERDLVGQADSLLALLPDPSAFRDEVVTRIVTTRSLLRLIEVDRDRVASFD